LAASLSTIWRATVHVADEGAETKKLIGTKARKLEIRWINIETREVGGQEENGISRLPMTRICTEVRVVRVILLANARSSNELLRIVGEDLICKRIAFCFGNTNPATRFLTTLRGKGVGFVSIENLLIPVKVQEWRDIWTLACSLFNRREAVEGR
jgi:hypothetical protein